jgi:UTP--glucose-1-phosphate uridylyltransferase
MSKVKKAIIPVAGMGTRFLPITKSVPKEMLPIVDKPTIQYIVEEAIESGIEEILFITSPYKKCIEDHFDKNYELEDRLLKNNKTKELDLIKDISSKVKIFYIRQGEPKGSGHAIKLAKAFINNEPFAVMYGDDLMYSPNTPVLKQLIDMYDQYNANIIGVQEVDKNIVNRYGIIKYEDETTGKIETIIEKPSIDNAPSTSAGLGRYIVNSEIFNILEQLGQGANCEYQFTDAMMILMNTQPFYACKFNGTYYDTGSKLGYLQANIEYALRREDLKQELEEYLGK